MIRKYELITIAKISLGEEGAQNLSNTIKDELTSQKAKIINSDFWGKRKFAYEIKHDSEGFYEVIEFELSSEKVDALKGKLNFMEDLVRYLVTAV